ncbi:YraN family protein [Rhodococcus sp. NPDC058514]|uniref:YraN family protein n=1 Tax=unclassified Rhodococcus (in: high G+C Gram-positive bacteria) TaxID=192944 RepID=UPI003653E55C
MARNLELGARGEELAAGHLTRAGMTILERNWRCRYGELDLIARDGDAVVFVEVKTRSGRGYGTPAEAVTFAKQGRIRRLAGLWLSGQAHGWRQVRFDVVAVVIESGRDPVLEHLRSVF